MSVIVLSLYPSAMRRVAHVGEEGLKVRPENLYPPAPVIPIVLVARVSAAVQHVLPDAISSGFAKTVRAGLGGLPLSL